MATKRIGEGMTHRTTLDGTERFLVTPGPDESVASTDMEFTKIEDVIKPDLVGPDDYTSLSRAALKALLDLLIPLSQKASANGVATLGGDAKIPLSQIPSLPALELLTDRVDNILENQDLDPNKDSELVDARLSGVTGILYALLANRLDAMEKYGTVMDEANEPIATVMLRVVDGQPQLVTEDI